MVFKSCNLRVIVALPQAVALACLELKTENSDICFSPKTVVALDKRCGNFLTKRQFWWTVYLPSPGFHHSVWVRSWVKVKERLNFLKKMSSFWCQNVKLFGWLFAPELNQCLIGLKFFQNGRCAKSTFCNSPFIVLERFSLAVLPIKFPA